MFKVYFDESFFDGLDYFINSMKNHYYYFYNNTGLYDEDKIIKSYFDIYEKMKTDVFNEIHSICQKGILGRKVNYDIENIESCSYIFKSGNYIINFSAIRDDKNKKIIVNSIMIEI